MRPHNFVERRKKARTVEFGVFYTVGGARLVYKDPEQMSTDEIVHELVSYNMRPQLVSVLTGYDITYITRVYLKVYNRVTAQRGRIRGNCEAFLHNDTLRRHAARVVSYYLDSALSSNVRYNNTRDMSIIVLLRVFRRYRLNEITPIFSINEVYTILNDLAESKIEIRACENHRTLMYYLYFPERQRCRCPYCNQDSVANGHGTVVVETGADGYLKRRIFQDRKIRRVDAASVVCTTNNSDTLPVDGVVAISPTIIPMSTVEKKKLRMDGKPRTDRKTKVARKPANQMARRSRQQARAARG